MRWLKPHLPWIIAILLVATLITRHIWGTRGWIETHDGIFHVIRLEEFTHMVQEGGLPVRWAGRLDNGFGLPLFNYVYPGPYYLGLPLMLAGVPAKWVVKLLAIGLYVLGGLGVYAAFAKRSQKLATISALLFLTTPYLLLNIFVRGALGELMAICLIPWVYVAWQDIKSRGLRWYHPIPYFLLFTSHNFLSFLFLPLYLLLAITDRSTLNATVKSLGLSFFLSAFFILPMIFERNLVYSGFSSDFTYNYRDHFVYLSQLVQSTWGRGHSVAGVGDGLSFQLGFGSLALVALALFAAPALLLPLLLILALLLPTGRIVWDVFTPLQVVQFPWRLLALIAVYMPYLAYHTIKRFGKDARIFVLLIILFDLFAAWKYSTPPYLMNNEQFATELYIHSEKTTTSSRLELLPRWADREERWRGAEDLRIVRGNTDVELVSSTPLKLVIEATTSDPTALVLIRRNYFPSWQAQDEKGEKVGLTPSDLGEILLAPTVGTHAYTVWAGSTPLERIANLISILAALYLLTRAVNPLFKKYLDTRYPDWDLSIALRYLPIVDDLKKRVKKTDKILEAGSEITGITPYLKLPVTGLDQGFDYTRRNAYLKPVKGSVIKMPFKDKSFDYSLSVDMLEHIPSKRRSAAIKEILRVTKKRVYLTFPCGEKSEEIDRMLDEYFYRKNGYHYDYLEEHVELGLPTSSYIPSLIKQSKEWQVTTDLGNTSLWLWSLMLKLGLSNAPWKTSLYRRLLLVIPILKHANRAPTYRRLYILDRIEPRVVSGVEP